MMRLITDTIRQDRRTRGVRLDLRRASDGRWARFAFPGRGAAQRSRTYLVPFLLSGGMCLAASLLVLRIGSGRGRLVPAGAD